MNAITKTALAQALLYYVVFRPYEMRTGLKVHLDPPGPNKWDVTAYMNSLPEEDRQELLAGKGHAGFTDLTNTPDWVLEWDGEFEMELCTSDGDQVTGQIEPPRTRYIARFTPQADQNKYIVSVDPRGPTDFEVTSIIENASDTVREAMLDGGNECSDSLREASHAPKWIRNWDGPFEVTVTEYEPHEMLPLDFVREPVAAKLRLDPGARCIVRFIPKGWSAENAREEVEIGPIGPDRWDVTDYFAGKSAEEIEWILGSDEQLRKLASHGEPYWVTRWTAPFAVEAEVFTKAEARKLETLRQSNRFYDPAKLTRLPSKVTSIPDSDGRYGRGVRDGIEALALALHQAGVDFSVIERAARTAEEGYGNNGDSVTEEIEDMLVVSTAHLTHQEREIKVTEDLSGNGIEHLVVSLQSEYGTVIYVPGEDVIDPKALLDSLEGKISAGFMAAVRRSIEIGAQYIYFDMDVEAVDGWPSYD